MGETMRALRLGERGLEFVRDAPVPSPQPGEALLRVRIAGICATDLEMVAGYKAGFSGVLGHEFVGEVVDANGDAPSGDGVSWIGRRAVGEINCGCGRCDLCRRGLAKHCQSRQTLGIVGRDGVFADYVTIPLANLQPPTDCQMARCFAERYTAALQALVRSRSHRRIGCA